MLFSSNKLCKLKKKKKIPVHISVFKSFNMQNIIYNVKVRLLMKH